MLQDLGCFMDEIMFKDAMTLKVKNETLKNQTLIKIDKNPYMIKNKHDSIHW